MPKLSDDLNDAQARHAIKLFYDHAPASLWAEGRKPSSERVDTVVRALNEAAMPQEQVALEKLLDDVSPEGQGTQAALARIVLEQALASSSLAPLARQAIADAAKPNMALDPVTGILIIGMLLATTRIDREADGAWHVHLGGGAADILTALKVPQLLEKLPAVLAALPSALISRWS